MINIFRDDTKVRINLQDRPLDSEYSFYFECGNKHYAQLLTRHFQEKLWNRTESIRKQEYEEGYKAGRSKKEKKKYFYSSMKLS